VHVEDEITELIQHYYSCSTIRARILEFMGGSSEADATAVYAVGNDGLSGFTDPVCPASLGEFLLGGYDVERSLWDRWSLIANMDIDYENFDYPAEPYLRPERVFALIQPLVRSSLQALKRTVSVHLRQSAVAATTWYGQFVGIPKRSGSFRVWAACPRPSLRGIADRTSRPETLLTWNSEELSLG
jgi:hypothetical protein